MSAIASYPGTVTPLRGLSPFAESERDVFFGRDRECEELARLVIGEGFRAGLLYGPSGVGKTSLLRAGAIPHLRDHGVVVLVCEDRQSPIASFARQVSTATGLAPAENERPITFLARVVGQSLAGQHYLFIVDEVEDVFRAGDDRVVGELGDLFARVVSRSGGRARFLFSCDSDRVHLFGALERRTGSLFPPSARYELHPFAPAVAADVLERTLSFAGVTTDATVPRAITDSAGQTGPVLPADLQIAMLAIRELGLTSSDKLEAIGGGGEVTGAWLSAACRATGSERSALRLAAELAGDGAGADVPEWAAARASLDPSFTAYALEVLADKGVVKRVVAEGSDSPHYALAHEILAPRVREAAAPARAAARRAFELLGSKSAHGKRLSLRNWLAVRREGIEPATPAERAVLERTKRTALIAAGALAAAPLVLLVAIYIALAGSHYLDVAHSPGGERVVVRAGKPALRSFFWLPHSPSFGAAVADTGVTRAMATEEAWEAIADGDRGRGLDGDAYAEAAMEALRPSLRALIEYAADGSESALGALRRGVETPEDVAWLLESLKPIARGGPQEVAVVEQALRDTSPAVQSAALAVAVATAERRDGAYRDLLASALGSSDSERRRLAFSAVRSLDDDSAMAVFQAALAAGPGPDARRELLAVVTREGPARGPSPTSATSVLANEELDDATRERARNLLRRSFLTGAAEASVAAAALAGNPEAPQQERIFALELLREHLDEEVADEIADDVRAAKRGAAEPIRAAALPVFARVVPEEAAGELADRLANSDLGASMREAVALAWGEVVEAEREAAQGALQGLLEDDDRDVRAAAARAYGELGRASQRTLIDRVREAPFSVKVGAAYGLANSAAAGGSGGTARSGIYHLWSDRGRSRRAAARVYAHMAHHAPNLVVRYAYSAARDDRDPRLHPIGVEGLCNGVAAGNRSARTYLVRVAGDAEPAVRDAILECALDHAEHTAMATRAARALDDDDDASIRAAAARVLARVAEIRDDVPSPASGSLLRLTRDGSRKVRLIALEGVTSLGSSAPDDVGEALADIFDGADRAEKLAILEAAGATGAGELATLGLADDAPQVRIAAMHTAVGTDTDASSAISSALTDPEATVRRAALDRIAGGDHPLSSSDESRALGLAVGDRDPEIGMLALEALARLGDVESVKARLGRMLDSRSERERARAARALSGLAERDPGAVRELLEPLLDDPSHDVRVALLDSLGSAYASTESPSELADLIRGSEGHATRRVVATAALVRAAGDAPQAAVDALESVGEGPPLARELARIGRGLIAAEADGVTFLALLVP